MASEWVSHLGNWRDKNRHWRVRHRYASDFEWMLACLHFLLWTLVLSCLSLSLHLPFLLSFLCLLFPHSFSPPPSTLRISCLQLIYKDHTPGWLLHSASWINSRDSLSNYKDLNRTESQFLLVLGTPADTQLLWGWPTFPSLAFSMHHWAMKLWEEWKWAGMPVTLQQCRRVT